MRLSLLVVCCWLSVALASAQEVHIPLHEGWTFCQVGKEPWYPATVPGVVHTDLLRNGLIPDPYMGSNVDSVQWIENEAWIYKRTIVATDTLLKHGHLDLVFKGLDTFAEVYLNDSLLGKADNMFRTWEWEVKDLLKLGDNELKVIFRSPIKEGAKLRDAYGIQLPHDNDPSGVSPYIRKAAYQFGWDFCPRLVTSGIWQGVELRGWKEARFDDLYIHEFMRSEIRQQVMPSFIFEKDANRKKVRYELWQNGKRVDRSGELWFKAKQEWWPAGSGSQPIHHLKVVAKLKGKVIASGERVFGRRMADLFETTDSIGSAFEFVVNEKPIFIKGCNLVPPTLLLPVGGDSAWVEQVCYMRQANMNMVRVWAGGVYPPEAFYYACDTAGIMVWQDFMFANFVPAEGPFLLNATYEVGQQLIRALKHPSVVHMCGNNELNVAWENWGWQERYDLHGFDSTRVIDSNRNLWSKVFPRQMMGYGSLDYTPTSPLSNWGNAEGLTKGDLHYWGVWHGDSTFSSFKNNVGRFVSEWGFQSYPDSALLSHYIDPKELFLGSPAVQRLQRSYKTDKPIWDAIERELGEEKPITLGGFIEASQRVQAKAYRLATEAHIAAQPHCMGTLLWQLNDCWPGTSWSIIDYEGNPKPAYYEVQKVFNEGPKEGKEVKK